MAIDLAQFHQVFFDESFEGLAAFEEELLGLDLDAIDPEQINTLFRAAHSVKGGAGTFGFQRISDFAHQMETLLDLLRKEQLPFSDPLRDLLLKSGDQLRLLVEAERDKQPADEATVADCLQQLQRACDGELEAVQAASPVELETTESPPVKPEQPSQGWLIRFRPYAHMMRTGNDPLRLIRELGSMGELQVICESDRLPQWNELDAEACYLGWQLELSGDVELAAIEDLFDWVEGDCDLQIEPLAPVDRSEGEITPEAVDEVAIEAGMEPDEPEPKAQPVAQETAPTGQSVSPKPTSAKSKPATEGSVRVSVDKVDSLVNLVGELVISQSVLENLVTGESGLKSERLLRALEQLQRHTHFLQEGVLSVRMLPISLCFNRFPRLVHDLGRQLGKQVELRLSGEQTELDKTVIEKITDPLVHLVRNSLDHGLEGPEERATRGKPEQGTIQLSARHEGGGVVIEIADDGRGLDREKILARARQQGLVGESQQLDPSAIDELIFAPGFSTAEQVSDISGRGVGMDVVKRNIHELGGHLEIESEPGQGSLVRVRLPLTLAIIEGQVVSIGPERYIMPLLSIIESIQPRTEQIRHLAGHGETLELRGDYLPIIRLHQLFGIDNPVASHLQDGLLVVAEAAGSRCALFVDNLVGQQTVVIKSLEQNYRNITGFSGGTILGDGQVALILDPAGLMAWAGRRLNEWRRSA